MSATQPPFNHTSATAHSAQPGVARPIIGESKPVRDMLTLISKVAVTKTNVLIIGESGTGKELVARMIHETGALKGKPFVPVNCGAIPETLIESEMFGHKRGSFTGAVGDKMGLFEAANQGTIFLDEVGELPLSMQVKLLRAIQERSIRKVGGNDDIKVDVRIIAATNRDLEAAVAKGTFREDLYYRLNVILIKTPPLRERHGDIGLLIDHTVARVSAKYKRDGLTISAEAKLALERYSWPGNIRELENVMERAVTLETTDQIQLMNLPQPIIDLAGVVIGSSSASSVNTSSVGSGGQLSVPPADFSKGPLNLDEILNNIEKAYLFAALEKSGGVKKKAADLLGITFRSIRYRLKKLGVDPGGDEGDEGGAESEG
jgi:two-component system response regulator PilR (NtrC family)